MLNQSRSKFKFNRDWKFLLGDINDAECYDFDDSQWELVNTPHTPKIEKVDVVEHYQGICWYRKEFEVVSTCSGRKIFIEFEAAMQVADVWVNGKHKVKHLGGFLPFTIDITEDVIWEKQNIIAVKLDNSDNDNIPPGKPLKKLDFCYFGGLYRNVWLYTTNEVHITDAVYANKVADGGVFVTYTDVTKESAKVHINTHVINESSVSKNVKLLTSIVDAKGNLAGKIDGLGETILAGLDYTFKETVTILNPMLWHPVHPFLYTVNIKVMDGNMLLDEFTTRIGIRTISCTKPDGFVINGEPIKIIGTNRHQQYPYIGNAASDNAHYRDALKLKEGGFNFIRLGHYPQSVSFMDACDELGIMVAVAVSGWQVSKEGIFKEIVRQNIKDMIRRDRNHPSAIMWEVSLNETADVEELKWGETWTGASDEFFHECHVIAHDEYPGDQMLTAGDTTGRINPAYVDFDIPYSHWDQDTFSRNMSDLPEKMGFIRECGDFEFGGNYSTTRAKRGDGENAMLLSAWNFQWSHNKNMGYDWSIGDAMWVGIDYNRGYFPDVPLCLCGVLDTFRLPKFGYYFFQSQRDIGDFIPGVNSEPVIYIANLWTPRLSPTKVVVYSNCEQVEIFINGKSQGLRSPDNGEYSEYNMPKNSADANYWMGQKDIDDSETNTDDINKNVNEMIEESVDSSYDFFDGGNCKNIRHAPFTFNDLNYEQGEIVAKGLIGGKVCATHSVITPEEANHISIKLDISGKELVADGADFIFVYAEVKDKNDATVPDAIQSITFTVEGPAKLIGENPICAELGIAPILLQASTEAGEIKVFAQADGLPTACITLNSVIADSFE